MGITESFIGVSAEYFFDGLLSDVAQRNLFVVVVAARDHNAFPVDLDGARARAATRLLHFGGFDVPVVAAIAKVVRAPDFDVVGERLGVFEELIHLRRLLRLIFTELKEVHRDLGRLDRVSCSRRYDRVTDLVTDSLEQSNVGFSLLEVATLHDGLVSLLIGAVEAQAKL